MVNDHSNSKSGNPLSPHGLLFLISSKGSFYFHHPIDRIAQPLIHQLWATTGITRPWYVLSCLWMVHIKEPLLLIGKSSLCGGSGFPLTI